MSVTFSRFLTQFGPMVPDLLRLQGLLMPAAPPPALLDLGLADEAGNLTNKGRKVLAHCIQLATLLDLDLH